MKKILLLGLALILTGSLALAQNSKVKTAALEVREGDFEKALTKLNEANERKEDLKEKFLAQMYYLYAQTYMALGTDSTAKSLYPNAMLKAAENYHLAMENDYRGKNEKQALLDNLPNSLVQNLTFYGYQDHFATGTEAGYEKAADYFEAAVKIDPTYLPAMRLGAYTSIELSDTTAALQKFEQLVEAYEKKYAEIDPEEMAEDQAYQDATDNLGNAMLSMSVLYQQTGEPRKALDILAKGQEMLPDTDSETRKEVKNNLEKQELYIYQQNPELFEEAKEKFERSIAKNPDDVSLKAAYAGLLEQNGELDEAHALYEERRLAGFVGHRVRRRAAGQDCRRPDRGPAAGHRAHGRGLGHRCRRRCHRGDGA